MEIEMEKLCLYGVKLPELKLENAEEILSLAQTIHRDKVDERQRNTKRRQWEQYWVDAYSVVLELLRSRKAGEV